MVIPSDVPTGRVIDVEDLNAAPGEIGRQGVSSLLSNLDLEFGEYKGLR